MTTTTNRRGEFTGGWDDLSRTDQIIVANALGPPAKLPSGPRISAEKWAGLGGRLSWSAALAAALRTARHATLYAHGEHDALLMLDDAVRGSLAAAQADETGRREAVRRVGTLRSLLAANVEDTATTEGPPAE
jgi:hypothetical protein